MLDTSVAISLRDNEPAILGRIASVESPLLISAVTRVELENGVYRDPALAARRRAALDVILATMIVVPFDDETAAAYGRIIAALGWSRTRIIDRMIAASAIVRDVPLATLNAADFYDVPNLRLDDWDAKAIR